MADEPERRLVERALPRYELGPVLGRGAWGTVISARHRDLGRDVAVKVLGPHLLDQAGARERFVTEAQLLAGLSHPHIVPVHDYVEAEGICVLVMELLTGGSLGDLARRRQLDAPTACAAVVAACSGLAHAHRSGVLHRDVKPENLMLAADGVLKVADFGIAKVLGAGSTATVAGQLMGSPAYMAPEQITGAEIGPAVDVYGAATVLYELLAGRLPHSLDGDAVSVAYRHVHEEPVALSAAALQVPVAVAQVVMGGIARDPVDRFGRTEDFAAAIVAAASDAWGAEWHHGSIVPLTRTALDDAGHGIATRPAPVRRTHPRRRRRWRVASVLLVVAALAAVVAVRFVAGTPARDAGSTRAEPTRRWSLEVAGPIVGSPVVVDDVVLVGADDGILRAVDLRSGTARWSYLTDAPLRATPTVVGDMVYAAGFDGAVHAVDIASGDVIWRASLGFQVFASPAVVSGSVIVVADAVHALDARDGTRRWRRELPEPSTSSPLVAQGRVIVGANDGVVRALDADTGAVVWEHTTDAPVVSSPAARGDLVFVGSDDGHVEALHLTDGTRRWRTDLGGPVRSSPLIVEGAVVIGSAAGITSLDADTGSVRWQVPLGAAVNASPVAAGDLVLVGDDAGVLRALDGASGEERWRVVTAGAILGRAAVAGDDVLVGSADGTLHALRSKR